MTAGATPTFVGSCWLAAGLVSGRAGAAELLLDDGLALVVDGVMEYIPLCRCRRAVHLHGGGSFQNFNFWFLG